MSEVSKARKKVRDESQRMYVDGSTRRMQEAGRWILVSLENDDTLRVVLVEGNVDNAPVESLPVSNLRQFQHVMELIEQRSRLTPLTLDDEAQAVMNAWEVHGLRVRGLLDQVE